MAEKIIDMATGEMIDKPDENALMLKEAAELQIDFETYEDLNEQIEYAQQQLEIWNENYDNLIINLLKKYNAKKLITKYYTYTLVGEQQNVQRLDTKALKEKAPEIYNQFSVFSNRAEYLRKTKRKY